MALTHKQQVFISEYLQCWNATEAARRAGYAHPNKQGPDNLVKLGIRAEIDKRLSELAMSANEVVFRLGNQARGSVGDFLTPSEENEGEFYIDISKGDLSLIKKLKHRRKIYRDSDGDIDYVEDHYEFELYDAQNALVNLGKYHGIFTDKVDHTSGGESLGDNLAKAIDKVYGSSE